MNAPARNRVTPLGEIVALPGRGAWMGNRGCLHEGRGARDIVREFRSKAWLTCVLEFRGRRVPQWEPGRYTPLFFLDEAVALAAGHRPCFECRRGDHVAYKQHWALAHDREPPYVKEIDETLHRERTDRAPLTATWASLPDGAFVATDDGPAVVREDLLTVWDARRNTYGTQLTRPRRGSAHVLTPSSNLAVLRAGYPVQIAARAT